MRTADLQETGQQAQSSVSRAWMAGKCPICGSNEVQTFFEMLGLPTSDGRLWLTREQAQAAPRGDIRLAFCATCGTIGNQAFDQENLTYGEAYNASLEHSPLYRRFLQDLVHDLVERHVVKHKTIVEMASGSGEFLRLLCRHGQNEGFGFDPSLPSPGVEHLGGGTVTFIQDFYSHQYAGYKGDLVCCRHLLSSVSNPKNLVGLARNALAGKPDGIVYFEVPDAVPMLRDAIWNLTYEHCYYLTGLSLGRLLAICGFNVRATIPCMAGQYVGAVASPVDVKSLSHTQAADVQVLADDVTAFAARHRTAVAMWGEHFDAIRRGGTRTVLWGAGGRAVTFLHALEVEREIEYVVDINPSKQGTYLAGTGHQIVHPSFLVDYRPELVIITNSAFEAEIRQQAGNLGLTCEFLVA